MVPSPGKQSTRERPSALNKSSTGMAASVLCQSPGEAQAPSSERVSARPSLGHAGRLQRGPQSGQLPRHRLQMLSLPWESPKSKSSLRFITGNVLRAQPSHFLSRNGLWLMASLEPHTPSWINDELLSRGCSLFLLHTHTHIHTHTHTLLYLTRPGPKPNDC